ncbi:single-stranded DNA-binding protein [Nocardiopsis sp. CA-288880]|uniref:single-stranded DNA-binding protein n=1 Tax=Nocardiopsis sp. CA-288880 TaxID=3239995 RepID=UPI003D958C5F
MSLPNLTVTARLVDAPEIKWSQSGTAIAKLRLVSNSRRKNPQTDQWEDGDTWWGRGTAFARTAEAIAEANLQKGDLVTVRGEIKTDQWEKDGQKRSADEVIIREIGRALMPPRQQQGGFSGGQQQADPWGQGGRPGFSNEEAPF